MSRPETLPPASASALPLSGAAAGASILHLLLPPAAATVAGLLLARALDIETSTSGLVLLGSSGLFAYLHDRLTPDRQRDDGLSNPRRSELLRRSAHLLPALALLALLTALAAASQSPLSRLGVAALLGLVALAYPALARMPLGKTLAVAGSWTVAATLLPAADPKLETLFRLEPLSLLLVVAAGTVLCDLKDGRGDRASGVRSLPACIGTRLSAAVAAATALAGAAIAMRSGCWGFAGGGGGLALLAARPAWLEAEIQGPLLVDGWLLLAFGAGLAAG